MVNRVSMVRVGVTIRARFCFSDSAGIGFPMWSEWNLTSGTRHVYTA